MGKPVKIHPVIASDVTSDEPAEIPICSRLNCHGNTCRTTPTAGGTLQDLRNLIERLFAKLAQDSNRQFVFELDLDTKKYVERSLDQLIDEYDFLTKYDKIVICCPLHYLTSRAYEEGESKITKLIYQFEYNELTSYPQLQEFYHSHLDSLRQKHLQFYFYQNMLSVAQQWVEFAKKAFHEGTSYRTQKQLETGDLNFTYND